MLTSDLCDFSDMYIVVKRDIIFTKTDGRDFIGLRNRVLAFKNNSPFTNCISKINNVLIDNAEDLDVVMPMYNLLEYGKNYSKITGRFWNYYSDEPNNPPLNPPVGNNLSTVNCNADPIANSESFKYKSSIPRKTSNTNWKNGRNTEQRNTKAKRNLEIVVPIKHLSNFWRSLDIPLINCEVFFILPWSENCRLTDITTQLARATQRDNPARPGINAPTNATFQIAQNCMLQPLLYQPKLV